MIDNHHLMCINKDRLGERYKEKRDDKRKAGNLPINSVDKPHTGCP